MMPSDPSPPASRAVLRRPRILLADAELSVIRALWRILHRCRPNFRINMAGSTSEALAALAELNYDVVITDLQLSGDGGNAVLEALVLHHPETARIVHSSQLELSDTDQVRWSSHAFLAKPASEQAFLKAVDTALLRVAGQRSSCASGS